jgi:DNA-binding NarL/FixJ family response regulator
VSGAAKTKMSEPERSATEAKIGIEKDGPRIRTYVRAESATMEERLVRALGTERDFEVVVQKVPPKLENRKSREPGCEILVLASGGNTQEDLRHAHAWRMAAPELRVLLLAMPERNEDVLFCVRGGVNGFLQMGATAKEIVEGVRALGRGEAICNGAQCALLFRYFEQEAEAFPSAALHRDLGLTRREQQLIPLLTRGLTNKEIANHFSLSEQTVKNHLYRMRRKIGAHGRLEIVDVCRQHGFLA